MEGASAAERAEQAQRHFADACRAQMQGDLDRAVALYRKSIDALPTAEAHTFLGWTFSFRGDYEAAIRECHQAIRLDPEFGNPYNDIGSYLIKLGRHADAVPWLRKAIAATRYEPRHYPHVNLARVYARQGKLHEAIAEVRHALALQPDYQPARAELHRLIAQLN